MCGRPAGWRVLADRARPGCRLPLRASVAGQGGAYRGVLPRRLQLVLCASVLEHELYIIVLFFAYFCFVIVFFLYHAVAFCCEYPVKNNMFHVIRHLFHELLFVYIFSSS